MTDGYKLSEIAAELGRPASWVSERLSDLRTELLLASGHFLPLADHEYDALRDSIARHGVRIPIIIGEHIALVDGRHRLLAATELGLTDIPAIFLHDLGPEAERELATSLNAARRHITRQQKKILVEHELTRDPNRSDRLIASICGVSHPFVATVRAEIAEQQRLEQVQMHAEAPSAPHLDEGSALMETIAAGPTIEVKNPEALYQAPAEAPQRVDATGRVQPAKRAPSIIAGVKPLAYLTCAHGQMHTLYRDPDYRLAAEDDRA